jgi:hypothetical protein
MNLAINDRHTFKVTALFVILGILFGVSVAFISVLGKSSIQYHEGLVEAANNNDVLIVLRADKVLAMQLQAALEQMKDLDRGYQTPTDRRIIMPTKQSSRGPRTIDL